MHLNKKSSHDILFQFYRKIEYYVHTFPCGCNEATTANNQENDHLIGIVHPTLPEMLKAPKLTLHMNPLDEKRQKKIVHNLESLKGWIPTNIQFDEINRSELIEQSNKIPRTLQQLAIDVILFIITDLSSCYSLDQFFSVVGTTVVTRCVSVDDL